MNPDIFRAYDIRGLADVDLDDETVETIGRAIGTYLAKRNVTRMSMARDCRLSSERIGVALKKGLVRTGMDVLDLGTVPTPVLYYSLHTIDVGGGVMVTGSHNPSEYNGLKIASGKNTLHSHQIQELRELCESGNFAEGEGQAVDYPLLEEYRSFLRKTFGRLPRSLRVGVDCGNGTASILSPGVFRDLGCEVVELYCEMDGRFPNHHPDPTIEENLQDLIRAVNGKALDLGIAFDGDADRIGVVDDQGEIVWGDHLMILFSREVLREHPGAAILGEVKCSKNLYDDIASHGGRPIMWKAGHSLMKAKMKEERALLAGEMSGHIFFADRFFGFDDATYSACRLLQILTRSGRRLSELLADVPPVFNTPELRVEVPERDKFEVVRRMTERLSRDHDVITIDGVRVTFEDGWGLVRASNTQPVLVLRFEAESQERLAQIQSQIEDLVASVVSEVAAERA